MGDEPMTKDAHRWGPLTGSLFVACAVAMFAIAGDAPDANEHTARQIVAYYSDRDGTVIASLVVGLIACALIVFFCAYLRGVLEGDLLPTVGFAGGVILAVGLAIDVTISVALVHSADHIDPVAVQSLSSLYSNDYIPFVLGAMLIMLGSGLAIVRQDSRPTSNR
jgi:ABC-type nickel/cobalt efflux system permease component RcnA